MWRAFKHETGSEVWECLKTLVSAVSLTDWFKINESRQFLKFFNLSKKQNNLPSILIKTSRIRTCESLSQFYQPTIGNRLPISLCLQLRKSSYTFVTFHHRRCSIPCHNKRKLTQTLFKAPRSLDSFNRATGVARCDVISHTKLTPAFWVLSYQVCLLFLCRISLSTIVKPCSV